MRGHSIMRVALVGVAYFGMVFVVGFALGTLRVLFVVPRLGEITGVLLELPILLTLAWLTCSWLIARYDVPSTIRARLVMGGCAFVVLMFAELGGSVIGFGRTLSEQIEEYRKLPALLGLAGQIAFAAFPMIQSATCAIRTVGR